MKVLRAWLMRLFGVFTSGRRDTDISAEIESHLQMHVDDNIRAGMTTSEARRRAVIALGSIEGTKEAVREFLNELSGIRGSRPVTAQELEKNKQALIRRFPSQFETVGGISNQLSSLVTYGLPDSYFNDYIAKINAVTINDVNRVANKYLDPDKMAIVIVGDRKVIEPGLKELGRPINILDTEGNPITQ